MTPAERDEVRAIAADVPNAAKWRALAAAILRYVPPGNAIDAMDVVEDLDLPTPSGRLGRVLIDTFSEMTTEGARIYAAAINAAADAAEEH